MAVTRSALQARTDGGWEIAADWLAADATVSTQAAIDSFADYGNTYRSLMFIFKVTGAKPATFVVDQSEDGTTLEDKSGGAGVEDTPCSAGMQRSVIVHEIPSLGWRVSAYSSDPGNPSTTVNRRVLGRRSR